MKRLWLAALACLPGAAYSAGGEAITLTGEMIDTWCYFSGVMGSEDSVVGSAHHTCALWCSAGGIPVGILAEDGTVYTVLKFEDSAETAGGDELLAVASDTVTVEGTHYARDGLNYITVSNVIENKGILNLNHTDVGFVPPFTVPKADR